MKATLWKWKEISYSKIGQMPQGSMVESTSDSGWRFTSYASRPWAHVTTVSNFWESRVKGKNFSASVRNSSVWCHMFSNDVEQLLMQILVKGEHLELSTKTRGYSGPGWTPLVFSSWLPTSYKNNTIFDIVSVFPAFFPPLDGGSSEVLLHAISPVNLRSLFINFMCLIAPLLD